MRKLRQTLRLLLGYVEIENALTERLRRVDERHRDVSEKEKAAPREPKVQGPKPDSMDRIGKNPESPRLRSGNQVDVPTQLDVVPIEKGFICAYVGGPQDGNPEGEIHTTR